MEKNLVGSHIVSTYKPSSSTYLFCGRGCCSRGGSGGKKIFLNDVDVNQVLQRVYPRLACIYEWSNAHQNHSVYLESEHQPDYGSRKKEKVQSQSSSANRWKFPIRETDRRHHQVRLKSSMGNHCYNVPTLLSCRDSIPLDMDHNRYELSNQ